MGWCNCRGAMGLGHHKQYPYKQIRNKNPFRLIDLIGWNNGFPKEISLQCQSGWWFGTFLFFPFIEKNNPNWPILFRGVGQPPTSNMLDYLELDSRSRHDLGLMAFSCPFSKAKARDPNDTLFLLRSDQISGSVDLMVVHNTHMQPMVLVHKNLQNWVILFG